jgi:hypothetical protein
MADAPTSELLTIPAARSAGMVNMCLSLDVYIHVNNYVNKNGNMFLNA